MRSSTVPPSSSQHSVYWALPGSMRPRSLVKQVLTKSAAPVPRTSALPRWLTSNRPTASRTALCSASTPPPAYSSGMSQPPNSASLAPRATWRSCKGECSRSMAPKLGHASGVRRACVAVDSRVADMLSVTLSTAKPTTARADALILGIRGDEDKGDLAATLDLLGFTGEKGQTVTFPAGDAAKASLIVAVALPEEPTRRGPAPGHGPRRAGRQERHEPRHRAAPGQASTRSRRSPKACRSAPTRTRRTRPRRRATPRSPSSRAP